MTGSKYEPGLGEGDMSTSSLDKMSFPNKKLSNATTNQMVSCIESCKEKIELIKTHAFSLFFPWRGWGVLNRTIRLV